MPNIKVIMKAPAQLKTLDDLLAQANHYAEFCLVRRGKSLK
jgi:precorrin-2 methylase